MYIGSPFPEQSYQGEKGFSNQQKSVIELLLKGSDTVRLKDPSLQQDLFRSLYSTLVRGFDRHL